MTIIAEFELKVQAVDPFADESRRRATTGGPMPSKNASAALDEAVEAFQNTLRFHGFLPAHSGYGVHAWED